MIPLSSKRNDLKNSIIQIDFCNRKTKVTTSEHSLPQSMYVRCDQWLDLLYCKHTLSTGHAVLMLYRSHSITPMGLLSWNNEFWQHFIAIKLQPSVVGKVIAIVKNTFGWTEKKIALKNGFLKNHLSPTIINNN